MLPCPKRFLENRFLPFSIENDAETIENGAETKHLNSTRTARPPKGPGSSSRIQMLKSPTTQWCLVWKPTQPMAYPFPVGNVITHYFKMSLPRGTVKMPCANWHNRSTLYRDLLTTLFSSITANQLNAETMFLPDIPDSCFRKAITL